MGCGHPETQSWCHTRPPLHLDEGVCAAFGPEFHHELFGLFGVEGKLMLLFKTGVLKKKSMHVLHSFATFTIII